MRPKVLKGKEELTALSKIGEVIKTLQIFDQALGKIVKLVTETTKANVCALYLVDSEKKELVLKAAKGIAPHFISRKRVKLGQGFLGEAAQEKKFLSVQVKEKGRYDLPLWDKKIASFLILPLKLDHHLLGLLDLRFFKPFKLDQKKDLLLNLAKEIATLIKGAKLFDETKKSLLEHQSLYQIGLLLTSAKELEEVLKVIVESAMKIAGTPAGSLALYDEKSQEFYLAVSIGFSQAFQEVSRWKLRSGGLTNHILRAQGPLVIPDVNFYPAFDNPVMIHEGVKSLVAIPLAEEGEIIGILYVDDFSPRDFNQTEVSILSLLANQATIAIMKTQLLEEIKKLAITDGLTDVYNHRYFQQRLDEEFKRAKRYHHPLSLILLDIDYFKAYNDRYGHPQGDLVLKQIARILKEQSREVDIVSRYGGEEFIVILPETEKEDAYEVAEKIRERVESFPFGRRPRLRPEGSGPEGAVSSPAGNGETQPQGIITVSLGVGSYPLDATLKEELVSRIDQAMYRAKKRGRNQVCLVQSLAKKREASPRR